MTNNPNSTKVLLCSPYGKAVGGISRWTGHILNYYKTNKSDRIVLKQFYPDVKGAYANTPKLLRILKGVIAYLPFLVKLNRELQRHTYDVVHFTSSASFSLIRDMLAIHVAKKNKVKTIVHFRFGRIPQIFQAKGWEYRLIKRVINAADKVIVIDENSYHTLIAAAYENILLLPNPLTPQIGEIISNNPRLVKETNKLLFVGHVVATKGVFELIEACKEISNIQLKMVGYVTEEMKLALTAKAGDNPENWLEFSGEIDFESTIKEMLTAGVFVLPTYTEGFPNVILESMACACPIVTTRVGAIPEMLDIAQGDNYGLCVEPKNVAQLKTAIEKMLDDREYALQCGANAQQRVNALYSMPSVWKQLEDIWIPVGACF